MRKAFLLSAASLVAIASPAIAQEHATKASKSDIVVTGTLAVEAAEKDMEQTPGGVALVSAADFRDTPVKNIKDILEYVPGVIMQPRMGDDARVSVRGSNLTNELAYVHTSFVKDQSPLRGRNVVLGIRTQF
ncbi:TonB-dependent receptor plug domain-containing protein [Qipengyuania flava]|nr:TonB-dependent receptor plug domain-containing protein [Qipengyuania flava]